MSRRRKKFAVAVLNLGQNNIICDVNSESSHFGL